MKGKRNLTITLVLVLLMALAAGIGQAQGPEGGISAQENMGYGFTYQGQLQNGVGPVNDTCSFQFSLYDAAASGAQIGTTQAKTGVTVTDGYFSIPDLDFGSGAFSGEARWLEVAVQCTSDVGYATLSPRQALTPAPYALALPGLRTEQANNSPNIIGGHSDNNVTPDVWGATISGGGRVAFPNRVTDHYGTVGGGHDNLAGNDGGSLNDAGSATVGGGYSNQATGPYAVVGGGESNEAGSSYSTVGGGHGNDATSQYATVGGGYYNLAGDQYTTVGGGEQNEADADYATVCGGYQNVVTDTYSTVGGGYDNKVTNEYAVIGGGKSNQAIGQYSAICGGVQNVASGSRSTVAGGASNVAGGDYSFAAGYRAKANHHGAFVWADLSFADLASTAEDQFLVRASGGVVFTSTTGAMLRLDPDSTSPSFIGGHTSNELTAGAYGATIGGGGASGNPNRVTDHYGTVGGGYFNRAGDWDGVPTDAQYATVGGGTYNTASGQYATVGGGTSNTASGQQATVGGGSANQATHDYATVAGGDSNEAKADYAIVGGGRLNDASDQYATVGGGSNNIASGMYATVPGGYWNRAQGDYSFAAGRQAKADHAGAFVWADSNAKDFGSTGSNQFLVRASGGVTMYTSSNLSTGVRVLAGGGSWSSASDREIKANLATVDGHGVLALLAEIPISTWNYKAQNASIRHMGPMAQDFYAAFGLGEGERYISTIDADGVALAAIQGLYELGQEQAVQIETLEAENSALTQQVEELAVERVALQRQLDALNARVEAIEATSLKGMAPAWFLQNGMMPSAGIVLVGLGLAWLKRRGIVLFPPKKGEQ